MITTVLTADNHSNVPHREEEARRVMEFIRDDGQARGVDLFGFSGDIVDGPMTEIDRLWLLRYIQSCANIAPTAICYGNHDPKFSLDFLSQIKAKHPIIVEAAAGVHIVDTKSGRLAVAMIAFPWKAELLARIGSVSVETSDQIVQTALCDIFRGMGVKVREIGLPTLALVHGTMRGSKIADDQPSRPLGMEIPREELAMVSADFYSVGHIHLRNEWKQNSAWICTPTSPFFTDYGEGRHEKSYILAEFDTEIANIEPGTCAKFQRIPTPVTPMLLIEDTYSRDENGGAWAFSTPWPDARGCDIRFRFNYPKEHEKEAKGAAKEIVAGLLAQGAVNVKPDPIPIPAESTRSLEIVKAKTLTEQAQLLWKKWDLKLSREEEQTLTERIEEIQTQCGFGQRLTLDAGIHIKSTRMKGWRCFPDEINLDFDAIQGEVIAVSGRNGEGKSLFWEIAIPGSLFREVPTHGKIGDHAIARDTFVETNFEYAGKDYTVSQIIDGQSGTGSASLHIGKTPVFGTDTALRTQYDKWAAENLPPLSLVTSTTFMPQESKGILGMGATARKSLILKAKGVERYEVLAEAARKQSTAVSKELDKVRARIEELGTGQSVAFCVEAMAKASDEKRVADEALRLGELTLKELQDKNVAIQKQRTEYDALVARRRELEAQEQKLRARITELDHLITNCQTVLSDREAIESAAKDVKSLTVALADLKASESELRVQLSEAQARAREKRNDLQRLNEKLAGLNRSIENAGKVLTEKDKILAALESEKNAKAALAELELAQESAWKEVESVQSQGVVSLEGRLGSSLDAHRIIAAGNADRPTEISQGALDADRTAEADAKEHPTKLSQSKATWQEAKAAVDRQRTELESLSRVALRVSEISDAERIIEEAKQEIAELRSLSEELPVEIRAAESAVTDIETTWASKIGIVATTQGEIDRLTPIAAKASRIEEAALKIGLRREERETVASEREGVLESLSKVITEAVAPPPLIPLAEHESAVSEARSAASGCQSTLALAEKALETAKAQETRRQELTASVRSLEKDVDRWNLVERTCGKDGLIAESVAAAGDEINEKANKLLRISGNTKYTIDLKTTKMTKDGKREIEGCPINVYNSETGQWQEGSTLSPGQRAFVNLPISLTIAEIGCKDSTVRPTIYQDEPTAGLDPIMRIEYMAMMRDVADRLDAKIFFTTHNEELMALADGRMHIEAGAITIT